MGLGISDVIGDIIAAGANLVTTTLNTGMNASFAKKARKENFEYNEQAANNADARQRAQYEDLYSPQAMLEQYSAAGLSPSMMMSGGQSATGSSSASGNISAGLQGPYPTPMPLDPMATAQIANLWADTEGKKADNTIKEIEAQLRKKSQILESTEIDMISTYLVNQETMQVESLMSAASRYDKYDDFVKYVNNDVNIDSNAELKAYVNTQAGQKTLQEIYKSAHNIDKEITQIEGDKEYANIMLEVYKKLNENDFANLTAQERISELHKIVELNNLEADKKETINKIFEGIKNEDLRAFMMILYMLGDRYLGSINAGYTTNRSFNVNTKK